MGFDRKYFNFAAVFLAIILAVAGVYFIWDGFFSEAGKARRFVAEQARTYEQKEKAYIEAMAADTYGGKTPKETLDLFVAALEKGDIELASKYFLLDENLSREKWVDLLLKTQEVGKLNSAINAVVASKVVTNDIIDENDYRLSGTDFSTGRNVYINMRFNEFSKVWKIEDLY